MSKALITGASGFVGQNLVKAAMNAGYEVVGVSMTSEGLPVRNVHLDLTSESDVSRLVISEKPDIIINAAALSAVNYCELHPEEAYRINVTGVKNLIAASKGFPISLVQFSSDRIFDGSTGCYDESSSATPDTVYGISKATAEEALLSSGLPFVIARLSLNYGNYPFTDRLTRFPSLLSKALSNEKEVNAAENSFFSPIHVKDTAQVVMFLLANGHQGIFNVAGPERISRYDFMCSIASHFNLNTENLHGVSRESFSPQLPCDVSLDVGKLSSTGFFPSAIDEGLERCYINY